MSGPSVESQPTDEHTPGIPAALVIECEISERITRIEPPGVAMNAFVLVRMFTEPLGMLRIALPTQGLQPSALARAIVSELGEELAERFTECGLEWTGELPTDGLAPSRGPRFLASRERVMRDGPAMTVAICTRDRTAGLAALLDSLRAQEYPRVRVLVIDNAPSDNRTRELVAGLEPGLDVGYVIEPRPGLSWARNRALAVCETEVIAWADDDEVCDRWWAAELARAFVEVPNADAATGSVVPAELQTSYQALFEEYSGVRRGRGFRGAVFSPATAAAQSPLYPLPRYGIGANMAFRCEALRRIGGFDPALGAGTATLAGEDTAAFSTLLLAGGTIVYQPTAIVRHSHRRDYASLQRVMLGYGRGLSAYYASMVARHPSCVPELARLSPRALRDHFGRDGRRLSELPGFPAELLAIHRKGLLQGALVYPGARLRARRLAGAEEMNR